MKRAKNIYMWLATVMILVGCQGDLLDTAPYGSISAGNMWTTESLTDKGVMGVYSCLRYSTVGLGLFNYDCWGVSSDNRDAVAMMVGSITTSSTTFSDYWKQHYESIHRANDALANLPESPVSDAKRARLIAEVKFLRAYFYYKLNMVYRGVPLYLEPVEEVEDCTNGRETESKIWEAVINDLTDCVNEVQLPDRYEAGSSEYGRITKAAALALRGKVYMWTEEWEKAETDFKRVGTMGHSLFQGGYKQLFKEANEQCEEMILSVQNIGLSGYGNEMSFRYGSRVTFGSCWNTYLVNTDFVDTYPYADGRKFDWDELFPGYNSMDPKARSVYFFRDGMTEDEINRITTNQSADMSKYLPDGNEARILVAYNDRDPRLLASVITPYSQYNGAIDVADYTYTLRWPYRGGDTSDPFDLRTDTNNRFHYLFRKFVAEGSSEIPERTYSPIDFPLIRYADVLLSLAEALNEQNKTNDAIQYINEVRARAGVALLNSNEHTQVTGQADLRERIRNERRWEFCGEGVNYFDEIRWKTWKESKFFAGSGLKQIWGEPYRTNSWQGDHYYIWAVPKQECEMNPNISQSAGWIN